MIIWFGGGLGNQMFQYALYKTAEEEGYTVKADLSWYRIKNNPVTYDLETLFHIRVNECTQDELNRTGSPGDLCDRILDKFNIGHPSFNHHKRKESKSKFIENLLRPEHKDKYLFGYWQSEKYFKYYEDKIRECFTFPVMEDRNKQLCDDMRCCDSVSLHVRRTSYLTPTAAKLYENLGETAYYQAAIKKVKELSGNNIKIYLFTDDIEWCKKNLDLDAEPVVVDNNRGADSYRDMQLMSCCKHNIIANSSFSWWGAWLNRYPEKIVIGPRNWFVRKSGYHSEMILPDSWLKL